MASRHLEVVEVPADRVSWRGRGGCFEHSDIRDIVGTYVPAAIRIVSPKTGVAKLYHLMGTTKDEEGDVLSMDYRVLREDYTLTVFND